MFESVSERKLDERIRDEIGEGVDNATTVERLNRFPVEIILEENHVSVRSTDGRFHLFVP